MTVLDKRWFDSAGNSPCPGALRDLRFGSRRLICAAVGLLQLIAAGCAALRAPPAEELASAPPQVRACARWFATLDDAIAKAGVADIAARRVDAFPYLRSDRFTASFAQTAMFDPQTFDAWTARMHDLDTEGRRAELANLPLPLPAALGVGDANAALEHAAECARQFAANDRASSERRALLARRAQVDDDYSWAKRALGLYPLTQLPFSVGIARWHRDTVETFQAARSGRASSHPVIRYLPPPGQRYTRDQVAALLAAGAATPLGIPELTAAERARLFATFAPVLAIEDAGDDDRVGALYWRAAPTPAVDVTRPTLYRKLAYTRYHDRTLLQLVYVAWLPARPKTGVFDLLGGRLDGLIWRVTLAPDGEPVLFDTIHPCGCYHLFFPTPRLEPLPAPNPLVEWAFSPAAMPALADGERVRVSVQTRTHYLSDVAIDAGGAGIEYALADYDRLRALPLPDGGSRSAFAADGLVPGTQRGERFLFWPMGIASPGAMRVWGAHATAFVGIRHFDDADLIERRFRLLR